MRLWRTIPQNTYLIRANKADLPVLRLVNGVQHVSLYQPAYKVRRSLLTRDEVVEVDVEFDGDQDMEVARTAIRGILDEDVRTDRIGDFAYSRLRATIANRAAILRRPEVTWVEPALQIEFSGERGSTIVAGLDDGSTPALEPDRYTDPMGHQAWLRSKGFCIPSVDDSGNCIAYWPKVAVIDSGLDTMVCSDSGYERDLVTGDFTGVCTDVITRSRHQDLNHLANKSNNCSGGINQGVSLDPILGCDKSAITELYFCSGDDDGDGDRNHCYLEGIPSTYRFSDNYQDDGLYKGHATAVTSVIAGDPYQLQQ